MKDGYQKAAAAALAAGGVVSGFLCPVCQGGRTGERSLSAWPHQQQQVAVVKCWRNSCGVSNVVTAAGNAVDSEGHKTKPTPLMRRLTPSAEKFLQSRYRIGPRTLSYWQVRQHIAETAIYLPVCDARRQRRGFVLRRFKRTPKAVSHKMLEPCTWQAWYVHPVPRPLVLVEDQLSALRVWHSGRTAVALLGTSLSDDKWREVRQYAGNQEIVIALDADAVSQAVKATMRRHGRLRAVTLWRDLKDSTEEELQACLS